MLGIIAASLLIGSVVNLAPLILWPICTAILGLACGLAVFAPDQNGGSQFLSAQRFPLGRFWAVKTLCWFVVLLVATALAWRAATGYVWFFVSIFSSSANEAGDAVIHSAQLLYWTQKWFGSPYWIPMQLPERFEISAAIVRHIIVPIALWPLFGFCLGHFFGLLAKRTIVAAFLAVCSTGLMLAAWMPSVLFGDVPFWWCLPVPAILLLATWRIMRAWSAGRLLAFRPIAAIGTALILCILCTAAFFRHRTVEIPDVGEPFDQKAFIASLPPPEENEAGTLLRRALNGMMAHYQREGLFPRENEALESRIQGHKRAAELAKVLDTGWPKQDAEMGGTLDRLFEGDWADEARRASRLPLGLLQDPRRISSHESLASLDTQCTIMSILFAARALQLQARGDSRSALNHLETLLALTRQTANNAPESIWNRAVYMEKFALAGFQLWLLNVGPDKKLLQDALVILQQYEGAAPDPVKSIKAQYLVDLDEKNFYDETLGSDDNKIVVRSVKLAYLAPWEKERQYRIFRADVAKHLAIMEYLRQRLADGEPFKLKLAIEESAKSLGNGLNDREWPEIFAHCLVTCRSEWFVPWHQTQDRFRRLHAAEIAMALALYQLDHGEPPEKLDDLAPAYLAVVPNDSMTGLPFDYRISKGEAINDAFGNVQLTVAPGQPLLRSGKDDAFIFLAPLLEKKGK